MKRVFICNSCNDAYLNIGNELVYNPQFITSPRGQLTHEILNVSITIKRPFNRLVTNRFRNLSLKYLVGEFLWHERGSNLLSEIAYYSSFWNKISDDGVTCNSSYGKKVYQISNLQYNQWNYIKKVLGEDVNSRRAVIFLGKKSDCKMDTKDLPCTLSLQFLIRDNKLHLIVNMRSNDIHLGFCYDVATFTLWQEKMLLELSRKYPDLQVGYYFHNVGSMHLYERNFNSLKQAVDNPKQNAINPLFSMPKMKDFSEMKKVFDIEEEKRNFTNRSIKYDDLNDPFCNWMIQVLENKT